MSEWEFEEADGFKKVFDKYKQDNPNEVKAIIRNLNKLFEALKQGVQFQQYNPKFMEHREGKGVRAIDESGSPGSLKATRLYIYPDLVTKTIYLITIGDKDTQARRDIPEAKHFVEELLRERENG